MSCLQLWSPVTEIRRLSKISCYWTKEDDFCSHKDFSTEFVEDVLTILEKLVFFNDCFEGKCFKGQRES